MYKSSYQTVHLSPIHPHQINSNFQKILHKKGAIEIRGSDRIYSKSEELIIPLHPKSKPPDHEILIYPGNGIEIGQCITSIKLPFLFLLFFGH